MEQKELEAKINACMQIENRNIEIKSAYLNMTAVTAYSGLLEDATLDDWKNWTSENPSIVPVTDWQDKFRGADANLMQATYVGEYDGEKGHVAATTTLDTTEQRVQQINESVEKIINYEGQEQGSQNKEVQILRDW